MTVAEYRIRVFAGCVEIAISERLFDEYLISNGSGRSSAEWDLDVAVYPPPRKRVFDGAREQRLGSATTTRVD